MRLTLRYKVTGMYIQWVCGCRASIGCYIHTTELKVVWFNYKTEFPISIFKMKLDEDI